MISWLHFGDLHASAEDGWQSLRDLAALADDANAHLRGCIDFAFLPGDNANHGTPDQYRRIAQVLVGLQLPWHAIPGDHDFEPGRLAAFHAGLGVPGLPAAVIAKGRRCLLLDIVSAGRGGPDFRLGAAQTEWLRAQLRESKADGERPVVLMHAFPGDMAPGSDDLGALFAAHEVACVDTGHTHYNELLNDGAVIYSATRSTGQVEEGPVGFSLHTVDGSAVAWRFKALQESWPLVMITSPCDRRLVTDARQRDQIPGGAFAVRAKVFGADDPPVTLTVGERKPQTMHPVPGEPALWTAQVHGLADGDHDLCVAARRADGGMAVDRITVRVRHQAAAERAPFGPRLGHDVHRIGDWPEHGLLGGQLGPNRNGRKW